jgi:hypothetical protein
MKRDRIVFLGGDARSRAMAERLALLGWSVMTYALGEWEGQDITTAPTLDAAIAQPCAVVLPMPAFDASGLLPCPLAPEISHRMDDVLARLSGGAPVFGGRVSPAVFARAADLAVDLTDYSVSD